MIIKLLLKEQQQNVDPKKNTMNEFDDFLLTNKDKNENIQKLDDKLQAYWDSFENNEKKIKFFDNLNNFINESKKSKILNKKINDLLKPQSLNLNTQIYGGLIGLFQDYFTNNNQNSQEARQINNELHSILCPLYLEINGIPEIVRHVASVNSFLNSVNSRVEYFIQEMIPYYKESTIGRLFGSGSADTNKLLEYFSETSAFIIKNLFDLYENSKIIFAKIIEVLDSQLQQQAQPAQPAQTQQPAQASVAKKSTITGDITIPADYFNKLDKQQRRDLVRALRAGGLLKEYQEHIQQLMPYMQKQIGFNRPPTINFLEDEQNASNPLGKTAYYNPSTMEISVYVTGRHPKDIMRSVAHELVHHAQNCRGDLSDDKVGEAGEGYAQSNTHLRNMEKEAYLLGNMMFRDWEDNYKKYNIGTNNMNKQLNEAHDCNKVHPGKSHAAYKRDDEMKSQDKPLDEWINEERWDLLMKRFKIVSEKRFANDKNLDNDGDGKPKWADKDDKNPEAGKREDRKVSDATVKKAHKIGKEVAKSGSAEEPYAVGMAVAKKLAKKSK